MIVRASAFARDEFRRRVAKRREARCVDVTDWMWRGDDGGVIRENKRGVMGPGSEVSEGCGKHFRTPRD